VSIDSESQAKTRALKILGSRELSGREMEKRLIEKGESAEVAQETVEWLVEIGYINDEKYAGQIVRHYAAKGYGIHRMKDELYKRGIPRELWDDALEEMPDMNDAAVEFLEKKLRGSREPDDIRRASDALGRRGFGYDDINSAVRRYMENVDG